MAKQTILTCDKHSEVVPAIGTFLLSNSKDRPPLFTIDLCQACYDEFVTGFMPGKRAARTMMESAERKKQRDRERYHRKQAEKKTEYAAGNVRIARLNAMWADREAKALEVIKRIKTNVHINDISQVLEVRHSTAREAVQHLITKGLVTTSGGVGRYRRYNIAG